MRELHTGNEHHPRILHVGWFRDHPQLHFKMVFYQSTMRPFHCRVHHEESEHPGLTVIFLGTITSFCHTLQVVPHAQVQFVYRSQSWRKVLQPFSKLHALRWSQPDGDICSLALEYWFSHLSAKSHMLPCCDVMFASQCHGLAGFWGAMFWTGYCPGAKHWCSWVQILILLPWPNLHRKRWTWSSPSSLRGSRGQLFGQLPTCSQLADWGASVSIFFHGCPLVSHSDGCCKKCPWKGRMASKLAQGIWLDNFSNKLLNLPQGTAHPFLQKRGESQRNCLLNSYNACKMAMAQRFVQVFSFWRELPWRLCALGICLFNDMDDMELQRQYVQSSKAFALDVIDLWNHMQTNPGQVSSGNGHVSFHMARHFLDRLFPQSLVAYVIWWASSSPVELVMPHPLAQALMKYCSALTVMQQLEAQHHFLHQKVSIGRASLPASTCAFLRRRTNKDLATPGLRDNLDRLLADLSKLVAIKWDSRTDSCAVFVFCCVP